MLFLTHWFPMHPFSTTWKCFQGVEKGCIGNEWVKQSEILCIKKNSHLIFSHINFSHHENGILYVLVGRVYKSSISWSSR